MMGAKGGSAGRGRYSHVFSLWYLIRVIPCAVLVLLDHKIALSCILDIIGVSRLHRAPALTMTLRKCRHCVAFVTRTNQNIDVQNAT